MTITCPDENGTICPIMEETGAGIGIFFQYIVASIPSLLIILVVIGAVAGLIGALAYVIRRSISGVRMK